MNRCDHQHLCKKGGRGKAEWNGSERPFAYRCVRIEGLLQVPKLRRNQSDILLDVEFTKVFRLIVWRRVQRNCLLCVISELRADLLSNVNNISHTNTLCSSV